MSDPSEPYELLFCTYSEARYDFFVVPYAYFALRNNPQCRVEVCLQDAVTFHARNASAVSVLEGLFPGRFLFRQSKECRRVRIKPSTVRFIERPELSATHVYIGDIEWLVLDDIAKTHLDLMRANALPFSNILRQQYAASAMPRLSGLHFCPFELYYPVPDLSDLDLSVVNAEYVLYECMRRKGVMVPLEFQHRPECGIHISLNRDPLGRTTGPREPFRAAKSLGWGGQHYYARLLEEIREEPFARLLPHLDLGFRLLMLALEGIATGQSRRLHRLALGYLVDKRLLVTKGDWSVAQGFTEAQSALRRDDRAAVASILATTALLWPTRVDVWFMQAYQAMIMGNTLQSVEALAHICDLPGGTEFLRQGDFVRSNATQIESVGSEGVDVLNRVGRGPRLNKAT